MSLVESHGKAQEHINFSTKESFIQQNNYFFSPTSVSFIDLKVYKERGEKTWNSHRGM